MSIHLPGLMDRYSHVPPLIAASGTAKARPSTSASSRASRRGGPRSTKFREKLARADLAAFETQGRFIQSRYGPDGPDAPVPATLPAKDGNGAIVDS